MFKQLIAAIACLSLLACSPNDNPNASLAGAKLPPAAETTINLDLIRQVLCIKDGEGGTGTMFYIGDGKFLTADHVSADRTCTDLATGQPLTILKRDKLKDIALLKMDIPTEQIQYKFKLNCKGFKKGKSYYAFGYHYILGYQGNRLVATKKFTGSDFIVDDVYKMEGLRVLVGFIIQGMSGGPIIDMETGEVIGLNNVTGSGGSRAYSRELKDTFICQP
jgi:S1-C subfamily serine protease